MPKVKPMLDLTKPMAKCERCKKLIVLASERRNEESHPFRLAKVPKGVCANCVMTQFLYNTYPINMQIDEAGPELLLKPGVPEAFLACGLLVHSDLKIEEVDWQQVVACWDLPVKVQKSGMNPYRMGESPAARARKAGLPRPSLKYVGHQETFESAAIERQQYCPKCGQPTTLGRTLADVLHRGAGEPTDCQNCGFTSQMVWLRDPPSEAVQ